MTVTKSLNVVRDEEAAKLSGLATSDSHRCGDVHRSPGAGDRNSSGAHSSRRGVAAVAADAMSSSLREYTAGEKIEEEWPSPCVACSLERQRTAAVDIYDTRGTVTAAGSETAASACASSETDYRLPDAAAAVPCPRPPLPSDAAREAEPVSRDVAAAYLLKDARSAADVASSSSTGDSLENPQLQSLSAFSRSVGISEFVLCDSITPAAAGEKQAAAAAGKEAETEAVAEENGAEARVGRASKPARPHALKGSLKTLFEDFQVYEHSDFPCLCRSAQRFCRECYSSNEDSEAITTCCSRKADSSRSGISNDGHRSTPNQLHSDKYSKSRDGNSAKKSTDASTCCRAANVAAALNGCCVYGCWCKTFGGDKPLRLPYLVLQSDVLRQKQQQFVLRSGAAHISTSFRMEPCEADRLRPGVQQECNSRSSTEAYVSGRGRVSIRNNDPSSSPDPCPTLPSPGSFGSSSHSGVDCVGEASEKSAECKRLICGTSEEKYDCEDSNARCSYCPPAAAADTSEQRPSAAAGEMTMKNIDPSFHRRCPFSSLEIQNVEAFVRFLAAASALYRYHGDVTNGKLQQRQEIAQQEAGTMLLEQHEEQKPEIIGEGRGPAQRQDISDTHVWHTGNTSSILENSRDLGMQSPVARWAHFSLAKEKKMPTSKASLKGGCTSCCGATGTHASGVMERWEAAAARVAVEAEENAVGAAAAFCCRNWSRSSSSLVQGMSALPTESSENPFFEQGKLHHKEFVRDTIPEREEHGTESQGREEPEAGGTKRSKGQRQSSREVLVFPPARHLPEPSCTGSEIHDAQKQRRQKKEGERGVCHGLQQPSQKGKGEIGICDEGHQRRQKRQVEKGGHQPMLWVLGDLASAICREMVEGEPTHDFDTDLFTEAACRAVVDSSSAMTGKEVNSPPLVRRGLDVSGYATAAPVVLSASDSFIAAKPGSVADKFEVAAAACANRSAPSLKDMLRAVRTSVHDYVRQKLPFVYADTLPLSLYLENVQQRSELQPKEKHQQRMQQKQVHSEQHEEGRRSGVLGLVENAPDLNENERARQGKQLQENDVQKKETHEQHWGLLRVYEPPAALQCVVIHPSATVAGTGQLAPAVAAHAKVSDTLIERAAADINSREASEGCNSPTLERSGGSGQAMDGETAEEQKHQFLKYFVSLAACVAQQCQALQQLLTRLERRQYRMQMRLTQAEEQVQQNNPHAEQRIDPLCYQDRQRLLLRLARCKDWSKLVTDALSALTDEKEQPHLMLMRLIPRPACVRYLFPNKTRDLLEKAPLQSPGTGFSSCTGAEGLQYRDSSSCCSSLKHGDQLADLAQTSSKWLLPVHLQQGVPAHAPFLHFVLLKINRDTAAATRLLEQQLRQQRMTHISSSGWAGEDGRRYARRSGMSAAFGAVAAAGTKDKRGVTVQRCSVSKVSADALLEACYLGQQQRHRLRRTQQYEQRQLQHQLQQLQQAQTMDVQQGDAEAVHDDKRVDWNGPDKEQLPTIFAAPLGYYSEPQWLGSLRGNFFQVIIRNLRQASNSRCDCAAATSASTCAEAPWLQVTPAGKSSARVSGSSAAAEAARPPKQQASALVEERSMNGRGGIPGAGPAAAMAPATEGAGERQGGGAALQTSVPQPSSRAAAHAAKDSLCPRNDVCTLPYVVGEEHEPNEATVDDVGMSPCSFFARLSDCDENVRELGEVVSTSMASFRSLGFLNYYGLQRFGTHTVRTHEVGAAMLRGDWTVAVAGILGEKIPVQSSESKKDAATRHCGETTRSDETSSPVSTERATGDEAATARGADDSQPASTGSLLVDSAQRVTVKSLWELLQEKGPAVALNSVAKHQHSERLILLALLQHSRAQAALKRRRESSSSSCNGDAPLSSVSASSLPSWPAFFDPQALSSSVVAGFPAAAIPPQDSTRLLETVSAPSVFIPEVPSSVGGIPSHVREQTSSSMPAGQSDTAYLPKSVESPTMQEAPTECRDGEHGIQKHGPRVQSFVGEREERKQRRRGSAREHHSCCLLVSTNLAGARAAATTQLERPLAADYGHVLQAGSPSAPADSISTATAKPGVAVAETPTVETLAPSQRSSSSVQPSRCPRGVPVQEKFLASPVVYFRALLEVAPTSLQLYLHAAQSVLFNFACSWRWRTYGPRVRVGDFVYCRTDRRSGSAEMQALALSFDEDRTLCNCEATTAAEGTGEHRDAGIDKHSCVEAADMDSVESGIFAKDVNDIQSQGITVGTSAGAADAQSRFRQKQPYDLSATSCRCDSRRRGEVRLTTGLNDGGNDGDSINSEEEDDRTHRHSKTVRKVTTEEEARNASIHDVVLPLAGTDVEYPVDLLTVYQQLSREILGVEFESFQRFNTLAVKRKCRRRQPRGQRNYDNRQRSSAGKDDKRTLDRRWNRGGSVCQGNNTNSGSTDSTPRTDERSNHCSNNVKGGTLGKKKDVQRSDGDVQTLVDCCEKERHTESEHTCTALLNSCGTACALAEAEEKVDLGDLGISCKGGFRPLLVRPRYCSWQLLRVGDDPDAEPKPLLLNDVDLLLRDRRSACRAEELDGTMLRNGESEQQQMREAVQDEFRIGFGAELASHLVRCIPGHQERDQSAGAVMLSKCGGAAEGVAITTLPNRDCLIQHDSEHICAVGMTVRASPSVDDRRRVNEEYSTKKLRDHASFDQRKIRTRRTDLMLHGERSNFCLLLRFWLPAGCYFTMALREIMRANAPDEDGAAFAGARRRTVTAD